MLIRAGNLILNQKGNPVALVDECEQCILFNTAYWRDRNIRNRVSEIVGGVKRHQRMPREMYTSLVESQGA